MQKLPVLFFLLIITTILFPSSLLSQEQNGEKLFEEKMQKASEKFKTLKIEPRKIKYREDSIFNKMKKPDWLTPEMEETMKKEQRNRLYNVMEKGEKYEKSVPMELYEKEYVEKELLAKQKNKALKERLQNLEMESTESSYFTWIIGALAIVAFIIMKKMTK